MKQHYGSTENIINVRSQTKVHKYYCIYMKYRKRQIHGDRSRLVVSKVRGRHGKGFVGHKNVLKLAIRDGYAIKKTIESCI